MQRKVINLFVLILLCSFLHQTIQGICSRASEKGPFKLKHSISNISRVGEIHLKGLLYKYPESIEVEMYNRWRYTNKCYTYWNFNQDCSKGLVEEVPTSTELLDWKLKGACYVGKTCLFNGDCWGSWAEECDKKYKAYSEKGENHPIEKSLPEKKRLYYTCIQKWRCLHSSGKTPVYAKVGRNSTVNAYISNGKGDLILISPKLYRGEVKVPEDDVYIKALNSLTAPTITEVKMGCYNSNKHISCYISGIEGIENTPFIMNQDRVSGQMHNYGIVVQQPTEHLLCRNPQSTDERSWCQALFAKSNKDMIAKTPTVEDLLGIIETSSLSQMVTSSIIKEIEIFQNKIAHNQFLMMKSISRLDPFLLGDIINDSIATTWFNEEIFYTAKCKDSRVNKNSNCEGRSIYKDGVHHPISTTDECINIQNADIKTIVMEDMKIDNMLHFTPLSPIASAGGWSVWEQYKAPHHETIERVHNVESKVSDISRILGIGSIFFSDAYKWWRGFVDFISVLNIVLFLVLLKRR